MAKFKYKLAPITSFLLIQEALHEAHENKQLVLLIGSTGYGKSIGFNHYISQNKQSVYAAIRPAERAKPFFMRLNDLLNDVFQEGPYKSNTTLDWLIETSSYEILSRNSSPLIVVDEAGNFSQAAQGYLRQLWDNIRSKSGLVVAGPDRYHLNLKNWNRDLSSGIPEFVSRISNTVILPAPSFDDIKLICSYNNIDDKKVVNHIFENTINLRGVEQYVERYHAGDSFWE